MGTVKVPACLFLWVAVSVPKSRTPCDILCSRRAAHEDYRRLQYGVLSVGRLRLVSAHTHRNHISSFGETDEYI